MRSPLLQCLLGAMVGVGATPALAHDSLGAESCQSCHADAWAAWKESPHARARDVLTPAQQRDARCVSCHSPNEADQKIVGVSCETCHGGGQYYSARYVMKDAELARLSGLVDPSEKQCRSCHDESSPSVRPFDFAARVKAIDHWSVERAKRAARTVPAPFRLGLVPKKTSAAMGLGGTK
ncbi:MAG: cytochrome c3 family protein [Archangium sp.]|nr:cytochrome c3 family protein [Archangium sp.]